jgi:hypothetical protein
VEVEETSLKLNLSLATFKLGSSIRLDFVISKKPTGATAHAHRSRLLSH